MGNEVAVIFRRKRLKDGSTEFIPIRMSVGYFDESDSFFIDEFGNTYHHICEFIDNGNVYGGRRSKESVANFAADENLTFNEVLTKMLGYAKKCRYIRKVDDEFDIRIISDNGESKIFVDKDSQRIKEIHDSVSSDEVKIQAEVSSLTNGELNPRKIVGEVKKFIVAQDEAIKTVVTQIIMQKRFPKLKKRNMFLVGPSGVGKTAIMETLSKVLEIPVTIFSVPGLSQAGYFGGDIKNILEAALINCNLDVSKVENSVIVLEEIDKIACRENDSGSVSTEGVQNELLKLIEGEKKTVVYRNKAYVIDTSKIIFVATGACQEFYNKQSKRKIGFEKADDMEVRKGITTDDLVDLGLKNELLGRMPVLIELNTLTKDDLIAILKNPYGELANMVEAFADMGITLTNIDMLYEMIAEEAIQRGTGARGIVSVVVNIFNEAAYIALSEPGVYKELVFGKNILTDKMDFKLIPKRVKKRNYQREYQKF